MTRQRATGAGVAGAAVAQTGAGLLAHVAAAGCLPTPAALALALPLCLALAVLATRLMRPLQALAVGQLGVHAALTVAACSGAGAHAASHASPAMGLAHVAALVLCRATLDHVLASAARAAGRLRRTVARWLRRPQPLRVPELPGRAPAPVTAAHPLVTLTSASRRGPPAAPRAA